VSHHRRIRRLPQLAVALAASACLLLLPAAAASAHTADNATPVVHNSPAPTIVRETVVQPSSGPGTTELVLIGIGAAAALLGAGYLGARIAVRDSSSQVRHSRAPRAN
jgi:hypothetical protein